MICTRNSIRKPTRMKMRIESRGPASATPAMMYMSGTKRAMRRSMNMTAWK